MWKDWKPRLGTKYNSKLPDESGFANPVFLKLVQWETVW
jgi:hypothetical protein